MIWCILYHMMRDPEYWTDPDTFNPERFLGEDGKVLKEERFVPYGIGISYKGFFIIVTLRIYFTGKRVCIGESLAKTELFIIFTRLMQLFTFESCEGHDKPTNQPVYAFILSPKPFYAKAVPRS